MIYLKVRAASIVVVTHRLQLNGAGLGWAGPLPQKAGNQLDLMVGLVTGGRVKLNIEYVLLADSAWLLPT